MYIAVRRPLVSCSCSCSKKENQTQKQTQRACPNPLVYTTVHTPSRPSSSGTRDRSVSSEAKRRNNLSESNRIALEPWSTWRLGSRGPRDPICRDMQRWDGMRGDGYADGDVWTMLARWTLDGKVDHVPPLSPFHLLPHPFHPPPPPPARPRILGPLQPHRTHPYPSIPSESARRTSEHTHERTLRTSTTMSTSESIDMGISTGTSEGIGTERLHT